MQKIDPGLFGKTNSAGATKVAVDRVKAAHKKRYDEGIEYSGGNNWSFGPLKSHDVSNW